MCVNEAIILQPEILSRLRGIERYEFQNQFIALFSQENLFSSDRRYNFDFLSWCWNTNELFYHEIVNQELLSAESLRLSCLVIRVVTQCEATDSFMPEATRWICNLGMILKRP